MGYLLEEDLAYNLSNTTNPLQTPKINAVSIEKLDGIINNLEILPTISAEDQAQFLQNLKANLLKIIHETDSNKTTEFSPKDLEKFIFFIPQRRNDQSLYYQLANIIPYSSQGINDAPSLWSSFINQLPSINLFKKSNTKEVQNTAEKLSIAPMLLSKKDCTSIQKALKGNVKSQNCTNMIDIRLVSQKESYDSVKINLDHPTDLDSINQVIKNTLSTKNMHYVTLQKSDLIKEKIEETTQIYNNPMENMHTEKLDLSSLILNSDMMEALPKNASHQRIKSALVGTNNNYDENTSLFEPRKQNTQSVNAGNIGKQIDAQQNNYEYNSKIVKKSIMNPIMNPEIIVQNPETMYYQEPVYTEKEMPIKQTPIPYSYTHNPYKTPTINEKQQGKIQSFINQDNPTCDTSQENNNKANSPWMYAIPLVVIGTAGGCGGYYYKNHTTNPQKVKIKNAKDKLAMKQSNKIHLNTGRAKVKTKKITNK
jgi:hypothetical protein